MLNHLHFFVRWRLLSLLLGVYLFVYFFLPPILCDLEMNGESTSIAKRLTLVFIIVSSFHSLFQPKDEQVHPQRITAKSPGRIFFVSFVIGIPTPLPFFPLPLTPLRHADQ